MEPQENMKTVRDFEACLLGGGIGDALGGAIEFYSLDTIRREHGPEGVQGFVDWVHYGMQAKACFTDDTQMTLFTADGLIRAWRHAQTVGDTRWYRRLTHQAYLRWFRTQELRDDWKEERPDDGWLFGHRELHRRMAPGSTCMSALASGRRGDVGNEGRLNDSKGCGTVMRLAPAGLLCGSPLMDAWDLGCDLGAITHGHETGIQSGGAFAVIVDALAQGVPLKEAIDRSLSRVTDAATAAAIEAARRVAAEHPATAESVEMLGEGWIAEEALSIALFCALKHPTDFRKAVLLSVNHSGDCDSTGAICGNLMGLLVGLDGLPAEWRSGIDMGDVLSQVGRDLHALRTGSDIPGDLDERYPLV